MRILGGIAALAVAAALLTGCATGGSGTNGAAGGSGATSKPTSTAPAQERVKPNFQPAYTPTSAADNQRLFVIMLEQGLVAEGTNAQSSGQAQRLAAAGFDPSGIEWTDNSTAIGLISDSMFVSAQVGGECLIAQYGNASPSLVLSIAAALPSGGCLLGTGINRF